jgi:hypothetical protein
MMLVTKYQILPSTVTEKNAMKNKHISHTNYTTVTYYIHKLFYYSILHIQAILLWHTTHTNYTTVTYYTHNLFYSSILHTNYSTVTYYTHKLYYCNILHTQ